MHTILRINFNLTVITLIFSHILPTKCFSKLPSLINHGRHPLPTRGEPGKSQKKLEKGEHFGFDKEELRVFPYYPGMGGQVCRDHFWWGAVPPLPVKPKGSNKQY